MKKTHKQDFWFNHITRCQKSSLTQKEYCKEQSLNFNTFVFWRMKFLNNKVNKTKDKSISFIPAVVSPQSIENYGQKDSSTLTIVLPNQVKLSIPGNLVFDEILALIKSLGSLS